MNRTLLTSATLALGVALAIAGCGGDGDDGGGGYGGGARESSSPKPATPAAAVVSVASVQGLGKVIVDSRGFTLYDFHKDRGTQSRCYGSCAKVWPPLTTSGTPNAENGALASQLSTTKRDDGTTQVTYAGRPLYTYTTDKKPGEAGGNDIDSFGAEWYALQPNGEEP
jgi:predicted lipoprotein with Yx(FWY)xxD motif